MRTLSTTITPNNNPPKKAPVTDVKYHGVYWHSTRKYWDPRVTIDGRCVHLGGCAESKLGAAMVDAVNCYMYKYKAVLNLPTYKKANYWLGRRFNTLDALLAHLRAVAALSRKNYRRGAKTKLVTLYRTAAEVATDG